MWLIVLCQCVYEKRLYESPSDSAIRFIKREKSFRLLNVTIFIVLTKRKKEKDRGKPKKKKRKKSKSEAKRKVMRKWKYNCVLFASYMKKKKKKKMKSCIEKKARSFHPAKFDHRNANCFHMCFHIWNFFFFLFFFFFFLSVWQNEIVQNKNSFWICSDAIITSRRSSIELLFSYFVFFFFFFLSL